MRIAVVLGHFKETAGWSETVEERLVDLPQIRDNLEGSAHASRSQQVEQPAERRFFAHPTSSMRITSGIGVSRWTDGSAPWLPSWDWARLAPIGNQTANLFRVGRTRVTGTMLAAVRRYSARHRSSNQKLSVFGGTRPSDAMRSTRARIGCW